MMLPLFDSQPEPARRAPSPLQLRRKRIREAFASADAKWQTAFSAFIVSYLASHGAATAEQIRIAYEKTSLPQPTGSKRASGAIYARLRASGTIKEVGREMSRMYGNGLVKYEIVR
jgi:hypothetical protein